MPENGSNYRDYHAVGNGIRRGQAMVDLGGNSVGEYRTRCFLLPPFQGGLVSLNSLSDIDVFSLHNSVRRVIGVALWKSLSATISNSVETSGKGLRLSPAAELVHSRLAALGSRPPRFTSLPLSSAGAKKSIDATVDVP